MLQRMSSQELTEWLAFYSLEPFGGDTPYLGHAITAATVANSNRKKGSKAAKVEDFMPKFERHEQTMEEQIQFAAMMTAALGGQNLREEAK
jgi:hypothetical protein